MTIVLIHNVITDCIGVQSNLFYPLKNLELVILSTQSKLGAESQRHYLGYIWWLLDPIINVIIFCLVFSLFVGGGRHDYIPFLFLGLICWKWFENSISKSCCSITSGIKIFSKVNVHKSLFPTVETLYHSWKFLVIMTMTLFIFLCLGWGHSFYLLTLPLILITEFILILGIAYFTSALLPFLPDLKFFIDYFLKFLFYLSGIFFDTNKIPDKYQILVKLNFFSGLLQSFRNVILYNISPNWAGLLYAFTLGLILLMLGYYIIDKNDKLYPKLCP